jgi:hypothetical protein
VTTELVLLLSISAFVLLGAFVGKGSGPKYAFLTGAPHLGARIEQQLTTGHGFPVERGSATLNKYLKPSQDAPQSEFAP